MTRTVGLTSPSRFASLVRKTAMTVLGAVGGAFAGNEIEKNVRSEIEHQMVVRLDDGTTRTFTQVGAFPYGVGERVRIVNGRVERG